MDNSMRFSKLKQFVLSIFCIILLVMVYCFLNYKELVSVFYEEKETEELLKNMDIAIGGDVAGIKLLATGVLVMGIDRDDTNLQIGDVITKINENKVETNASVSEYAKNSNGNPLKLEIKRDNEIFYEELTPLKDEVSNEYKLGLWVKDSSAGVGTITFYDKKTNKFAALGHAVTETKENYILPITSGAITKTNIYSIKKGVSKAPGELKGTINTQPIGQIIGNTQNGVFGILEDKSYIKDKESIEILPKTQIKEKEAKILCTVDDTGVREYSITIEKVNLTSDGNKNMIIKITDARLMELTGGIIQGMSGSPIIQDGKLVGAVTHVFLNDPTRGYGSFAENMITDMNSVN